MRVATSLVAIALAACALTASAQRYPVKPIRLIVPFSPGGNVDVTSRILSAVLTDYFAQSVIVDNRSGAGGTIGGSLVAKSAPDGYTLLMGSSGLLTAGPAVRASMPYDPVRDFAPISLVQTVPMVLLASPKSPANNLRELIALARQRPGQVTMAAGDAGSSNHLAVELINAMAGVKFLPVIFKGGGQSLPQLMGGQIDSQMSQPTSAITLIRDGRVKAIAVTTMKRSPAMPTVATMDESGLKGFEASTMLGVLAPAGTPATVINTLNAAILTALRSAAVKEKFQMLGADPQETTPQQFRAYLQSDLEKWKNVVKTAGIHVD